MKLEIESVEIKNFFCFGNKWQKVNLLPGINLISGFDSSTARSNGSGKSSFIDSIVFGLFGQTTKDVNKPQIVNWKNKKECEVKVFFKKVNDSFYIHRGLKPNFIKLFKKTGASAYAELDQLSSMVDIQEYIEKNILEIDFDTFVSIIHYNPTISKSIFNVQKSQKRSFIEKIFGLEMYSDVMKKCNEKLLYINSKLVECDRIIEFCKKNIESITEQNISLKNTLSDVIDKSEIIKLENTLKTLNDKMTTDSQAIQDIAGKSSTLDDKYALTNENIQLLSQEIYAIESDLKKYSNIESVSFDFDVYEKLKNDIFDMSNESYDTSILYNDIDRLNNEISSNKELITHDKLAIKDIEIELSNIDKLSSGTCPLCNHEIEKQDIDAKKLVLLNTLSEYNVHITQINEKIQENILYISNIKEQINIVNNKNIEYVKLQKKLTLLESQKVKYDLFNDNKEYIEELNAKLHKLLKEKTILIEELKKLDKMKAFIDKKNISLRNTFNELNIVTFQIKSTKKTVIEQEKKNSELTMLIEDNEKKISEHSTEIQNETKKIKSYKNMLDYLEFVKKICKDENVKQYAISNVVPFLSQRANTYLADAGFDFYLKLDNWLNVEIKGAGIREGMFGNLSSGQQKTTNLAMILAFLDIFKLQTAVWPDILLLDEILDGAIDSITLTQMFNIISKKQKEDNLKLFIVSHRKEINEIGQIDNFYRIEMQNGFSKIMKVG